MGDTTTIEASLALADVDAIAEAMSTWTWRGDHRTEADRDYYRDMARAVIELLSAKAEETTRLDRIAEGLREEASRA